MELQFYTHVNTLIYYYHYTKYDAIINFMNSGYMYNEIIEVINNELNIAIQELAVNANPANPIIYGNPPYPVNPVNNNFAQQFINNPAIINDYQINTINNQIILNNNAINNQAINNNAINNQIYDNEVNDNEVNDNQIYDNQIYDNQNNDNQETTPTEEFNDEFFDNPPPPPKLARH